MVSGKVFTHFRHICGKITCLIIHSIPRSCFCLVTQRSFPRRGEERCVTRQKGLRERLILDRIEWNSKPPSSQIKDEATQKPKRAIFPSLIFGGRGRGYKFPLILSKIVDNTCPVFSFGSRSKSYISRGRLVVWFCSFWASWSMHNILNIIIFSFIKLLPLKYLLFSDFFKRCKKIRWLASTLRVKRYVMLLHLPRKCCHVSVW